MIILLFSLAFSQTEKHNIKDIVEVDGLFYKNFSKDAVIINSALTCRALFTSHTKLTAYQRLHQSSH